MVRYILIGALGFLTATGSAFADGAGVRVLSYAQNPNDAVGAAVTKGLQDGFAAKGLAKAAETPEPALLRELKTKNVVQGQSLDEVKGLDVGAAHLVAGDYTSAEGKVSVTARLIDVTTGEVVASVTETGDTGEAAGKAAAEKLAASLAKPAAGAAKVETVDVEATGMAPGNLPGSAARTVALADAKRNAIENGIGVVVNVTKVPDLKQVKANAQSMLRYRVISEGKENGKYVVRIAANVDVPADLAAKYPAPAKAISDETGFKPYIERSPKGEVDWEKGILRVIGRAKGAPADDAKGQLNARRAAVADAYARAMEVVSGVRVDGDTKVSDAEKKDKQLRVKIEGLVQGGKIVKDNPAGAQGNYEVTLEVPMRGLRGVQTVFLDQLAQPKSLKTETAAVEPEEEFTGIVIDARGTGLQPGMLPQILDETGATVADPAESDRAALKAKGQAAYVTADPGTDLSLLEHGRVGPRPLVFTAAVGEAYQVASLGTAPLLIGQAKAIDFSARANRRQGPKPLVVKGLNTKGPTKVNLLVSTNYQNKAQFKKNLAKAFGKCKVVVVMDSQIGGTEGKLLRPDEILVLTLR